MFRAGLYTYSRPLRYRNKRVHLPGGSTHTFLVGEVKGVDVRLALDITRLAHRNQYDVALVFSQDQDLSEVADEIRLIAQEQSRWIKLACAYPFSPTSRNRRGVNRTDWIHIDDRSTYDACLDPRDYRRGAYQRPDWFWDIDRPSPQGGFPAAWTPVMKTGWWWHETYRLIVSALAAMPYRLVFTDQLGLHCYPFLSDYTRFGSDCA